MRGIGLVEIILVIALAAIATFIYVPYLRSFQKTNDVNLAAEVISQSIKRAQARALAGEEDSQWGVRVENRRVVVFKGADFDDRDPNFDETIRIPTTITISGQSELVFNKLTGQLQLSPGQSALTITISGDTGSSKNLTIGPYVVE